ncbi:MAG: PIG-L family deacetylase [Verrucomicrobia bacterium]|nr:PIG-L family deacetylase [Verrucomicrobiota bacterium]
MSAEVGVLKPTKLDEVLHIVTGVVRGGLTGANPYTRFVTDHVRLQIEARAFALGGFPPAPRPTLAPEAPRALFFAPHPDDETIVGAMALRMFREAGIKLVNVAVTQGSKKERQAERLAELRNACNYLGYELQTTVPNGLEKVGVRTRENDSQRWAGMVKVITDILLKHHPKVILFPHERDWNGTHIGVHYLVTDALKQMPADFECYTVETEFWGAMDDPNLMVEVSADDLADLITATTFHVGEVNRNPYHLLLPAWMMDNVRRGAELVGGQGGAAPDFTFAALYRLRKWSQGRLNNVLTGGKFLSKSENPASLFP